MDAEHSNPIYYHQLEQGGFPLEKMVSFSSWRVTVLALVHTREKNDASFILM